MLLWKCKKSPLDKRLKRLDAEMARLNAEIGQISRSGRLRNENVSRLNLKKTDRLSQENIDQSIKSRHAVCGQVFSKESCQNAQGGSTATAQETFRQNDKLHAGTRQGREKFVNYFAAGHFHNLRPLRKQDDALRNKAIMMAILAALAAFGLLFHVFGR